MTSEEKDFVSGVAGATTSTPGNEHKSPEIVVVGADDDTSRSLAGSTSRANWTKAEDVRLLLCLLDDSQAVSDGQTLIEYFRYERPRDQLDKGYQAGEAVLAQLFNDSDKYFPREESVVALQRFNPNPTTDEGEGDARNQQLHLPRPQSAIVRRFKNDIMAQIKGWFACFNVSGRGRFDEWDWSRHPVAEVLCRLRRDLLQLFVSAIVRDVTTSASSSVSELGFEPADDLSENLQATNADFMTPTRTMTTRHGTTHQTQMDSDEKVSSEFDDERSISGSTRSYSEFEQVGGDELERLSAFIRSGGSSTAATTSSKRRKLSEQQMRMTLDTYRSVVQSQATRDIALAMRELASAMRNS